MDQELVFGLDIGTRNVVGTVGYKDGDEFEVIAQSNVEHETRSMLDGQIHDIGRVGRTIAKVKASLEEQTKETLKDVCIAAAGRVLKTEQVHVEYHYEEETVVDIEHIHNLDLLGVEKAQEKLNEENDTKFRFYCVGYSTVRYYLNDDPISNLEGHKADKISEDIIATFLPEDVVDGLYSAVNAADLEVANLTLEPIAAINIAIPEAFRLLNIALVDVGAGTSDISITRDGSIIAYGMIPHAGDEITELIVQHYLVDFKMAEHIKLTSTFEEEITYTDIMMLEHTISSKEVWDLVEPTVDMITTEVANKIIELNGDKSVSACFVVGGGGKIHGFTEMLAEKLSIVKERVALRGEEVMQKVHFEQEEIKKDPLLVTPIGICLNYYDQKNNFIFLKFNGERLKLYDNNKLTIMDAAMAAGFPTEDLFPRRGNEINFTVNGKPRISRGEAGEAAIIKMNGREVNLSTPIYSNVEIEVIPSTAGKVATCRIEDLKEYTREDITVNINGQQVTCPKFVEVNGSLEPGSYEVQDGDSIILRDFYTIDQLCRFVDVALEEGTEIYVNNEEATPDTLVYEQFSVRWTVSESFTHYVEPEVEEEETGKTQEPDQNSVEEATNEETSEVTDKDSNEVVKENDAEESSEESHEESSEEAVEDSAPDSDLNSMKESDKEEVDEATDEAVEETLEETTEETTEKTTEESTEESTEEASEEISEEAEKTNEFRPDLEQMEKKHQHQPEELSYDMLVYVNNQPVTLTGRQQYMFVDIFDVIDFDISESNGRGVVTTVNGANANYTQLLHTGDKIEVYWKER